MDEITSWVAYDFLGTVTAFLQTAPPKKGKKAKLRKKGKAKK